MQSTNWPVKLGIQRGIDLKRKICIVTGTRADYGLLNPIMKLVDKDSSLKLQIIATGMHLAPEYGNTYQAIEKDGFQITKKIEMLLASDSEIGIVKSMGLGLIGFADALNELNPDLLLLLGDRFEALIAAQAAMIHKIPIAHIHGGEATQGLIDEAIRHSITKMAHLHFASTEVYRKRIIQLGEIPEHVFNFGAPGLDNIKNLPLLTREAICQELGIKQSDRYFLVTYHPVTLSNESPKAQLEHLFKALDQFKEHKVVITLPNADPKGREIAELLKNYQQNKTERVSIHISLGQIRYLSACKHADAVIGNSSSGIIEVPFLGVTSINIGERQKNRITPESVINVRADEQEIANGISSALTQQGKLRDIRTPYGDGNASPKIVEVLKNFKLDNILMKQFYDVDFNI